MGNKLNKIYEKSMDNYNKGYIEKALEECEKGISLNLKDVRLLNLKGMLLYIKGDLKGAIAVWKINKDYNNDEISKIYIRDAKKDEENIKLYSLAEHDIKELKIDNAIEKLEKCRVSDFNSINVNNALSICYLRKGNYLKAMEFNEASLIINKEGKTALEIRNQINGYLQDPVDEFKNSIKKKALIILLILLGVIAIFIFLNSNKKDEGLSNNTENIVANEEIINKEIINEEVNNEEVNNDEKKYDESIEKLQSAYNSDVDTYYRKHVLFLLASCYYEKNQINEAIQYYEEYIGKYDETYIEEIYYKLALAYENIDLNKSKEYANYIKNKFSNSIYNNSKISQIIYK